MTQHVGVLELASKYRYGLTSRGVPMYLFRPYDEEVPDMIVGCKERDITRNQIAIVEVATAAATVAAAAAAAAVATAVATTVATTATADSSGKVRGSLVRLLAPVGDRKAEEAALLEHYCPTIRRSKEAGAGAAVTMKDTVAATKVRPLLDTTTGWTTFHVDPIGCLDIDDAIGWSAEKGLWAVTIADVASLDGATDAHIDATARAHGQTFYNLNGKALRPMLPASLSEGEGSLLPGEERPGVTAYFTRDGTECVGWEQTRIIVHHSFDYESFAPALLDLPAEPACTDSHAWIADWMIRYNTAAAKELCRIGMGLLRIQSAADAAAVGAWRNIHPDLAWMANEAATYEALTSKETPNKGHAGMGGIAYTHASSPLRRYADLVNQRILTASILGGVKPVMAESLAPLAAHLNERCKAERRWSRDLTFLEHVRPGRVQTIRIVWVDEGRIWIPEWRRIIRVRHTPSCQKAPGSEERIQIFCDPTKRSWKRRVLTAELPQTR